MFFASTAHAQDPWSCPTPATPHDAYVWLEDDAADTIQASLQAALTGLDDGSCTPEEVQNGDFRETHTCCTTAAGDDWCHIVGTDDDQTTTEAWVVTTPNREWSHLELNLTLIAEDDGYHGTYETLMVASWDGQVDVSLPVSSSFSSDEVLFSDDDSQLTLRSHTTADCTVSMSEGTGADAVETRTVTVNDAEVRVTWDPADTCHTGAGLGWASLDHTYGWVTQVGWQPVPDPCAAPSPWGSSEADTAEDTAEDTETDTGTALSAGGCATAPGAGRWLGLGLAALALRRRSA